MNQDVVVSLTMDAISVAMKVAVPMLGAPTGNSYTDWNVENGYIISSDVGPIRLRFVADMTDVSKMDAMFSEGLAERIGIEIAQPVTQSDARLQTIASLYKKFMDEARTINAIEDGYDDPPDEGRFLAERPWACVGLPELGAPDPSDDDIRQLVVPAAPGDPCGAVFHFTLRGCDDDATCAIPEWDVSASPPDWWPCD